MVDEISSRQQQILDLLLKNKAGLRIDEVASKLGISRNAAQQHIDKLERDGYIRTGMLNKTGGRPVRVFVLTENGLNNFPKQYAWFSALILAKLKQEMGAEALQHYLDDMASSLAQGLLPQFAGKGVEERLAELIRIMNELGYEAGIAKKDGGELEFEAFNCIYHDLAHTYDQVCDFDRTLISALMDKSIDHLECMAKGGAVCKFRIKKEGN